MIEESPSGSLLFPTAKPDEKIRFTRNDIRAVADVFKLLDQWEQDAEQDAELTDDGRDG